MDQKASDGRIDQSGFQFLRGLREVREYVTQPIVPELEECVTQVAERAERRSQLLRQLPGNQVITAN